MGGWERRWAGGIEGSRSGKNIALRADIDALPILENETIWLPGNSAPVAYLDTQDAAKAVVQSLGNTEYDKKTVSLIGEKFWTS